MVLFCIFFPLLLHILNNLKRLANIILPKYINWYSKAALWKLFRTFTLQAWIKGRRQMFHTYNIYFSTNINYMYLFHSLFPVLFFSLYLFILSIWINYLHFRVEITTVSYNTIIYIVYLCTERPCTICKCNTSTCTASGSIKKWMWLCDCDSKMDADSSNKRGSVNVLQKKKRYNSCSWVFLGAFTHTASVRIAKYGRSVINRILYPWRVY